MFFVLILTILQALWSQLDFPVECRNSQVADRTPRRSLLRWCLGSHAPRSYPLQQNSHLAVTCLRRWSRRSSMVSSMYQTRLGCSVLIPHQMLWGTSSLALYIPWAGAAGPYLGISLWLWLGVLDAVQGVGLGMILLQVWFFSVSIRWL
jgi:hypothetical protein